MATAEKIASGGDGYISFGEQIQKYGYRKTAACMLCQKAHACGSSWNGELQKETIGHIQSAGHSRAQCVHPGAATRS
jgi:hypothetical protein